MEKYVGYTLCYKADMQCLFQLLLNREKDVVEVHKLFERMYDCISYRRLLDVPKTPEQFSHACRSVIEVDKDLRELMRAWCLN